MSEQPGLAKECCGNCKEYVDPYEDSENPFCYLFECQVTPNSKPKTATCFSPYAVPPRELGADLKAKDLEKEREIEENDRQAELQREKNYEAYLKQENQKEK